MKKKHEELPVRRYLHKELPAFLGDRPDPAPLDGLDLPAGEIPPEVAERWPRAAESLLGAEARPEQAGYMRPPIDDQTFVPEVHRNL